MGLVRVIIFLCIKVVNRDLQPIIFDLFCVTDEYRSLIFFTPRTFFTNTKKIQEIHS